MMNQNMYIMKQKTKAKQKCNLIHPWIISLEKSIKYSLSLVVVGVVDVIVFVADDIFTFQFGFFFQLTSSLLHI